MSWLAVIVFGASGVVAMRAAMQRGDVDEAARQGALAGPAVVERALADRDRTTVLGAIAATTIVEDRAELLAPLAHLAAGPDRRMAIPAAGAARVIARELARRGRPDDIAADDVAGWRAAWAELAMRGDRWIELRLLALDAAAALDPAGLGVDLSAALADPDPAFRRAAVTVVALPAPPASYAALANAVIHDADRRVALGAAQSLCLTATASAATVPPAVPNAVLDALGDAGQVRLRSLVAAGPASDLEVQAAAHCLTGPAGTR